MHTGKEARVQVIAAGCCFAAESGGNEWVARGVLLRTTINRTCSTLGQFTSACA